MITTKSVESGFALADELADKGLTIIPVPNTPLAQLFGATNTLHCCYGDPNVEDQLANGVEGINDMASYVSNLAKQIETNSTNAYRLHDQEMDNYIKIVKNAVSHHLDIAKNVVKPLVLELADKTLESFNSDAARDPSEGFNIECVDVCPVVSVFNFGDNLKRYDGKVPALPKARITFKEDQNIDFAGIQDIVGNYYPDIKAELIDWFNKGSTSTIANILNGFIGKSQDEAVTSFYLDNKVDDITILNNLICLYLVALHLYETPSFGIGYTLSSWKETVAQLRDYAGARINQLLRKLGSYDRYKTIILKTDLSKNTLYVHGPNYRQWLKDGGSPEVLYAIMLNNEGMVTADTINASKESLLNKWKKYNVLKDVAFKNNKLQRFKDHLRFVFLDQLKELTDVELAFGGSDVNALRNNIVKRFESNLANIKLHSIDNIYKTARKLICRSRFYYTSADKILSAIEEYSRADERIDAQEASLMATIEYIADYVAEQITLTDIPC